MIRRTYSLLLTVALLAAGLSAYAIDRQTLKTYAQSLKGKKKEALKEAVYELTKSATVLSYGKGDNSTWWGFYVTDQDADGYVIDRYSNNKVPFGNRGTAASGMNIEHSFPKSWWGGAENQAYKDLYNLMPSDSKANSSKGNYGMGVVTTVSYDNGCIKVGKGASGTQLWEPSAEWKGDFARGYMYMATTYQKLTFEGEGLNSLVNGTWPTLQKWAYTLYLKWMREDKVSQTEVSRNNAVAEIQGNRNLYVDFPTLAEYVWGDSTEVAFNPDVALTTADGDNRYAEYTPSGGGGNEGGGDEGGSGEGGGSEGGGGLPITPEGYLLDEPFNDITDGNNTDNSGSGTAWNGCEHFVSATKAYEAGGAVKLGSGSASGSITSKPLTFAGGTLCVRLDVKGWTTVEGQLVVSLTGSASQTVTYTAKIADAFETVTLKFEGVAANPQLTIETSTKRAFVDNIYVYSPTSTGVEMPVVQVSTHETYYTLSGQRLAKRPTQPGIYIIGGKKVVVK